MLWSGGTRAQTIGPGTVTTTQTLNIAGRTTTVVANTTIQPSASGATGINISAGSVVTAPGGPVTIATNNATGIVVQTAASATLNANATVRVTANAGAAGADMSAVRVISNGSANLAGVTVETFGSGTGSAFIANALFANGAGTSIAATNTSLTTHGDFAFGANATNGAINLAGGGNTIATSGNSARGLYAIGTGFITASGLTIGTTGANAIGAFALTGGTIDLGANARITTQGAGAFGAEANGAKLTVRGGGQIETSGAGAWGVASVAGGTVELTGGNIRISTTGDPLANSGAYGLLATGAGSTITSDQIAVSTAGASAYGAFADAGGTITIGEASSIATSGASANAINATGVDGGGNASLVTVGRGASISTQGSNAIGVQAMNGAKVDMSAGGASIGTLQGGSYGIYATRGTGTAASVVATGVTVSTQGVSADGARADNGSSISLANSTVQAFGAGSNGIIALNDGIVSATGSAIASSGDGGAGAVVDGPGSVLRFQGANSIATSGVAAPAILVRNGARLTFDNSSNVLPSLTVQGQQSALLAAQNPGSALNIGPDVAVKNGGNFTGVVGALSRTGSTITFDQGSSLQLSSPDSPALALAAGGNIVLNGATVRSQGAGSSFGLLATFGTASAPNTLTMKGAALVADQATALRAEGAVLQVAASQGAQITGPRLLVATTSSAVSLAASGGTTLVGNTIADASSTADIDLTTSSRWTGSASNVTSVDLDGSSQWTMNGSSTVGQVGNAGTIQFTGPAADPTLLSNYKTLTVTNYLGNGGMLSLNTYLASDGAPSDRLVISDGAATGQSFIGVTTTGPGDMTAGDGIKVVEAVNGGTTGVNAFALGSPAVAGPYEYTLFRGGDAADSENDWFLRNNLSPPPSPPSPPPPPTPHYRQEVSLYAAITPMAAIYGRTLIDTLHERVGEEEQLRGQPSASGRDTVNGAWGRIIGHSGERDGDQGGIYEGAPKFDYDFWALQAGTDLLRRERADGGRDHAGLYVAYGHGDLDVTHDLPLLNRSFSAGKDKFDAFTLGGYWTRFGGERDWYVDTVVQGTWYDVTTHSLRNTLVGFPDQDVSGFGFAASLEGGYPFALGAGWSIEPQAQLVYQSVGFDDFNDGAAQVRFSTLDSLAGRIGARLARSWAMAEAEQGAGAATAPRLATVWGRVNLWHEFLADSQVSFSSADGFVPFSADLEESWIEFGIGASFQVADKTTLYGNVNYETSFDGDSHGFDGKLGVRVNW